MLPNEEVVQSLSILDMVSNSTLLAKIVLLVLLMFSVLSWTIIFAKFFVVPTCP